MVHYLTTLYWIRHVIYHYGGLAAPLAIGVLVLLCGYLALYPAVFAWVCRRWEGCGALWVLGLPSVWVALEWVRAYALTGFPWANLGYTQTGFAALIQVADVTGVYGISWLLVLANTVLMSILWWKPSRVGIAVLALCLAGAFWYGTLRIEEVRRFQEGFTPWSAAVVQGNIDQSLKWDPAYQQETLRRYRELSLRAVGHHPAPDFLVWPETSAPFFYGAAPNLTRQLNEMITEIGRPTLFGSPALTREEGEVRLQNRAYLVDDSGAVLGSYAKRHLVPFGEYVPLKKLLFFVNRLVEAAGDFVPGGDSAPMVWSDRKLGVLICYEGIFPALARETVRKGAEVLVIITNDAWYGPTSAPYQHMEMARWRAIEFRRPVLRAANTGVSAIFDSAGNECGRIPLDEPGQLVCPVRSGTIETFYGRWGDVFAWLCVAGAMVGAGLAKFMRKRGIAAEPRLR
jgi:apolipoprotein N-acyltransferase